MGRFEVQGDVRCIRYGTPHVTDISRRCDFDADVEQIPVLERRLVLALRCQCTVASGRHIVHALTRNRNEEDAQVAIDSAKKAFSSFQHTHPKVRARILRKWYDLMMQNREDLARILMFETGRPIGGALQEIDYAASFLDWFAGEAERSYGYSAQGSISGNRFVTIAQPVGLVGILTPWNFPSAMITRKMGGAIAAGCSVVLKPAGETPYSALALAKLGMQAGLPEGVFNIVTTDKNVAAVGKILTTHPEIKKISFTGSTGVGKLLMQQASSTMKKCSFELGGNAPYIGTVFSSPSLLSSIWV